MAENLYSLLKFARATAHLQTLIDGGLPPPAHVRIKPVNRCNHDCWYCAYRVGNLQLGEDMDEKDILPDAKFFEICEDVISMGTKAVTFSGGGEPLLHKALPAVIKMLRLGGVRVGALSNGSNLKGRMAEAFAEHATWIRISTEGWDDETFAKARRIKPGAFTQILRNIKNFSSMGSKCELGISFIIDHENHKHVHEACCLFKEAGASHVKLSGVVVSNLGAENNTYHANIKDEVAKEIQKCLGLRDEKFGVFDHYHDLAERFDKTYTRCPYMTYQTIIGADQVVYTCHDKAYTKDGTLGSIRERRFKDFWFSEQNKARMAVVNPSKICSHHCVADSKNRIILDVLDMDPEHAVFI